MSPKTRVRQRAGPRSLRRPRSASPQAPVARVLVFDSDRAEVLRVSDGLLRDGCRVETVEQPSRVIERVKNQQADVLILAAEDRGVKSYDLIPIIRNIDRTIPVIVTAADDSIETATRVREQGVFFYAVKPLDVREMRLAVRNALSRKLGSKQKTEPVEKEKGADFEEEIVGIAEASRILKLSEAAATRMARSGEIPASHVGHKWRFVRNQLYEWLRITAAGNQRNYGTLILEAMDEGVAVVDRGLRILSCNSAYLQSLDIPRDRVIGEHCYRVSHRSLVPCEASTCPAQQAFKTARPVKFTHVNYDADGKEHYCDIVALPLKDEHGKVSRLVEIIRDNTEIYNLNRHLSWVVGFVAHELKGTLGSVVMNISALADVKLARTIPDGKRGEMLLASLSSLKMMHDMVRNYLLTSKSKSGQLQFKVTRLDIGRDVVRPAIDELKPVLTKRGMKVRLEVADARPVHCDRDLMRIAVGNLINNAAKYGTAGTEIECRVSTGSEGVEFSIFDEGIGIPSDKLAAVFEEFTRFDPTGICGTGLGLYVVKTIARMHGGDVRAESGFIIAGTPMTYDQFYADDELCDLKQDDLRRFARFTVRIPDLEPAR